MNRYVGIVLLAAGLAATPVFAQGRAQPRTPREEPPPLRGPEVRPNRPAQLEDRFSAGQRGGMDGRGMPLREFQRIVTQLGEESTPANLRLSAEQKTKIQDIQQQFRRDMAAAQQRGGARGEGAQRPAGGDEQRPQRPAGRGQGAGAGGERPAPADRPQQGRPQRGEAQGGQAGGMMGPGPGAAGMRPQDVQTKIWAVLTEPQQKHVEQEMEKVRKEMEAQRMEDYARRRVAERQGGENRPADPAAAGRPAAPGAPGTAAGEDRPVPERLRRIAERLRELSPEQREEVLKKIEAELDKAQLPKR
jgi:hypothetical protein